MAEVAAGAAGSLSGELRPAGATANQALGLATAGDEALTRLAALMAPDHGGRTGDPRETPRPAAPPSGSPVEAAAGTDAAGGEEPTDAADETPAAHEPSWSERPVLELGANFGSTPVWPHPDAE
jgi:hypothetical protein